MNTLNAEKKRREDANRRLKSSLISHCAILRNEAYCEFADAIEDKDWNDMSSDHCEKMACQSVIEDIESLRFNYALKNKGNIDESTLSVYDEIKDLYR